MPARDAQGRFVSGGGGADFQLRGSCWLNEAEVRERVRRSASERLANAAALIEAEAKLLISKGAVYRKDFDSDGNEIKIPERNTSNLPRTITGNLRSSIRYEKVGEGYVVGPSTPGWYGRVHEFGAVIAVTQRMRSYLYHKYRWRVGAVIIIKKRPFMRPALENAKERIPALFRDLDIRGPVTERDTR